MALGGNPEEQLRRSRCWAGADSEFQRGSAHALERAAEKPSTRPPAESRNPAPGLAEKRALGLERLCLNEHALHIQLAEQLLEHRPQRLIEIRCATVDLGDRPVTDQTQKHKICDLRSSGWEQSSTTSVCCRKSVAQPRGPRPPHNHAGNAYCQERLQPHRGGAISKAACTDSGHHNTAPALSPP